MGVWFVFGTRSVMAREIILILTSALAGPVLAVTFYLFSY
jgi:hypothetical protein